jgi:OmpA-OmpF porin, OOP family
MTMSFRKTLLAATLLSLPMAANAQSWDPRVQGVYVGAGLGGNYLMGSSDSIGTPARTVEPGFEWGWAGVLSVGYGFGNGLRLELEGSYRTNDIDTIKGAPGRYSRAGGSAQSYGAMVNALYDFNLGGIAPYVGVGLGYQIHNYDGVSGRSGTTTVALDGDEGNFAYQAIVGVALPIAPVPGLALTAEYRFMGTLGHDIDGSITTTGVGGTTRRATFEADNFNHSIMFGVRYNFNHSIMFGRRRAPGKCVYVKSVSWVRIPPHPPVLLRAALSA